jgi:hypothetical protein
VAIVAIVAIVVAAADVADAVVTAEDGAANATSSDGE